MVARSEVDTTCPQVSVLASQLELPPPAPPEPPSLLLPHATNDVTIAPRTIPRAPLMVGNVGPASGFVNSTTPTRAGAPRNPGRSLVRVRARSHDSRRFGP